MFDWYTSAFDQMKVDLLYAEFGGIALDDLNIWLLRELFLVSIESSMMRSSGSGSTLRFFSCSY